MQGVLTMDRTGSVFIFRDDFTPDGKIHAWEYYADAGIHAITYKWDRLPAGHVSLFNLDNPPSTVPYTPLLD